MGKHELLETALLEAYRRTINENMPDWAVRKRNSNEIVKPTIPFVGKNYADQAHKILVYASAENLSGYWKGNRHSWQGDILDNDAWAENRHRRSLEELNSDPNKFFPNVHIGPMNDGRLATAAYYIARKLYNMIFDSPNKFYEAIAFANYGKFSIETEKQKKARIGCEKDGKSANIDYAGNCDLLAVSHCYIQADMEILKPDCIIMPKTMYRADREFVDRYKGNAVIIPISQMNARVINCHIARLHEKYDKEQLPSSVRKWYDMLKTNDNYLSVFRYLDHVLDHEVR